MPLFSLIYFSQFCIDVALNSMSDQLNDLLRAAHRNNDMFGITGVLIFDADWFVQVLEGEPGPLWSTFTKIERDTRHRNVTIVEGLRVAGRSFGTWSMGCAEKNRKNAPLFDPYLRGGVFRPDLMSRIELRALLTVLAQRGLPESVHPVVVDPRE